MKKPIITQETYQTAYAEMRAAGEPITVETFRAKLGGKGGQDLLCAFLRKAKDLERQTAELLTPEETRMTLDLSRQMKEEIENRLKSVFGHERAELIIGAEVVEQECAFLRATGERAREDMEGLREELKRTQSLLMIAQADSAKLIPLLEKLRDVETLATQEKSGLQNQLHLAELQLARLAAKAEAQTGISQASK
jgi:hypothetical protein